MTDLTSIKQALAPCPFCGGDGRLCEYDERMFFVSCTDCYCCVGESYDCDAMPEHMFHTPEEATADWNRRAPHEQLEAENAALKAERDRLREALKKIAHAPAWGAPERWEPTPAEVRQLARSALSTGQEEGNG